MPDIDLGIPPFVVNWFMQDPFKAVAIVACVCAAIWAMLNPDFTLGGNASGPDGDGDCGGGDGGGD